MPNHYSSPTLYNQVLQISITKLKQWQYLKSNQMKGGRISWYRSGNQSSSISIFVCTYSEQEYVELEYEYRGELRNYKIDLVSIPSNLGKGFIWYFLCPETNKRCRKLYLVGGYFLHREAFKDCMYESQIQSKKYRELNKTFGAYFKIDELYEQLYQKHFKKTYAGKPTKKYLRIMEQIQKAEIVPTAEIERSFLK